MKERFTGPRARVAVLGIAVATVGAACTPAQRAAIEAAFPCAPEPVARAADGDTAVSKNPNQITISGDIIDDRKAAIIYFPTGKQTITPPTPTPTPEVDVTNYSVKAFLKLEDKKIDKKGVIKIITANAPMIVEDLNTNGYPNLTSEKYLKQVENFLDPYFKGVQMDKSGLSAIVARIVASIENAQKAAATGDFKKADAYINVAEAYVKAGKTTFDFRKSPKELDAEIARQAKYYNIK